MLDFKVFICISFFHVTNEIKTSKEELAHPRAHVEPCYF